MIETFKIKRALRWILHNHLLLWITQAVRSFSRVIKIIAQQISIQNIDSLTIII